MFAGRCNIKRGSGSQVRMHPAAMHPGRATDGVGRRRKKHAGGSDGLAANQWQAVAEREDACFEL